MASRDVSMDSVCILIQYSGRLNELGVIPLKREEASVLKNKHHYNKLPDLVAIFSTNLIQIEIKGRERFKNSPFKNINTAYVVDKWKLLDITQAFCLHYLI